jgi:hypothetical protein
MAQVVQCLLNKCEDLNSMPRTTKKKKEKKKKCTFEFHYLKKI